VRLFEAVTSSAGIIHSAATLSLISLETLSTPSEKGRDLKSSTVSEEPGCCCLSSLVVIRLKWQKAGRARLWRETHVPNYPILICDLRFGTDRVPKGIRIIGIGVDSVENE
jgi:hypothetical protein